MFNPNSFLPFAQDAVATQVALHPLLVAEGGNPTENQAVEAGQNSHDQITEFRDTLVHGVLFRTAVHLQTSTMVLTQGERPVLPGSSLFFWPVDCELSTVDSFPGLVTCHSSLATTLGLRPLPRCVKAFLIPESTEERDRR